ncbi:hypothetical protein DLR72_04300 [Vibrio paracholerae]|uniref:Uncharacterized protein n=1 Tax=Vibrio paracholerae TaxID=650003 RepID=A0ABD7FY20_9VIBR|nr:hypothetical protein DLR72_04300 [Vibrio paracholerae]TXX50772.1 hypothetical protein FXF14_04965 [Vibrio cholerae]
MAITDHSRCTTNTLTVLSALVFEPRPALWAGLVLAKRREFRRCPNCPKSPRVKWCVKTHGE